MRDGIRRWFAGGACVMALAAPMGAASAAELGDFCWLTDQGTILRLSLTQSGTNHYTYTGAFDDSDGGYTYALIGQASLVGNSIEGSFSGSLSTPTVFKTGTWHLSINPSTLAASLEGIRNVYTRGGDPNVIATGYRVHTATHAACP